MKNIKTIFSLEEWNLILSFYHQNRKIKYNDSRWHSIFGISFSTLQLIWFYIATYFNINQQFSFIIKPIHLIWTLYYLKINNTWLATSLTLRSDPKTLRKWINIIIRLIPRALGNVNI